MIGYINFNANPKNNDTNDCVIRAIAFYRYAIFFQTQHHIPVSIFKNDICIETLMEDKELISSFYFAIYEKLANIGIENSLMLNDERNYQEYLKEGLGLEEVKFEKRTMTVNKLKNFSRNHDMLVNLNGHLTVIIDGHLIDTFDCREEYVESIFY